MTDAAAYDPMFTALCNELGYCLHEKGQKRVIEALGEGLDAATKAVFAANGADYLNARGDLRRAVRDCLKANLPQG